MKKLLLSCNVLLIFIFNNAQEISQKVQSKNLRPSIVEAYSDNAGGGVSSQVIDYMKMVKIPNQFNDHNINIPVIKNAPKKELNNDIGSKVGKMFSKKGKFKDTEERNLFYDGVADVLAKDIIAKWFNRDASGNFNNDLVESRGIYTSTDEDYILNKTAQVDRRAMLGDKLIDKTFLIFYEINKIDYSNPKDPSQGYTAKYDVKAYQLEWNEDVNSKFSDLYWSDQESPNAENIARWKNAKFNMNLVAEASGSASSSDDISSMIASKFNREYENPSDKENLMELATQIKNQALLKMIKRIDALKTKASIYSVYPATAKIGSKENLKLDDRFYAYEIVDDGHGNQSKKRKGVLRVKKVTDNIGIATGETEQTVFYQVGGNKLEEGMLIEHTPDWGITAHAGYTISPNKALGGVNLGIDYRTSDLLNKIKLIKSPLTSLYAGIDVNFMPFSDINYGGNKLTGIALNLNFLLSKEFYFTKKGNVFAQPYLGVGYSAYLISKMNDVKLDKNSEGNKWTAMAIPFKIGVGYNVHPMVTIMVRPGIIKTFGYQTDKKQKLQNDDNHDQGWGLDQLEGGFNFNGSINVKIRF